MLKEKPSRYAVPMTKPNSITRCPASTRCAEIDDASLLELLLGDIREDVFAKRAANNVEPVDRIPSAALAEALAGIEVRLGLSTVEPRSRSHPASSPGC